MTDPEGPGDAQPQGKQPRGEREDRPELDFDSAFAAIVAGFSAPAPQGVGPWPAAEDLDEPRRDEGGGDAAPPVPAPGGTAAADAGPADPGPADAVPAGTAPAGGADAGRPDAPVRRIAVPDAADEEEGYQPPDPPPLPRGDLVSRLAWGAVLGGPVFLLAAALVWRSLPTVLLLLALTAFVGGFVTLVARMPQEHPDDPDDGAVV